MTHPAGQSFEEKVSRVAIIDGYEYRYLLLGVSRFLKQHYHSYVCIYVQSEDAKKELAPYLDKKHIDEIKVIPPWKKIALEKISKTDVDAVLKKAVEIEQFLGVTYNLVRMTRRDLGLGFYLGAYCYPDSLISKHATYEQTINAYNYIFSYWKDELAHEKITLVINGLKEPEVVANVLNIPYRYLFCTRVDNFFHWTRSLFCDFPEVKLHYEILKDQEFSPVHLEKQFFLDVTHKNRIFSKTPLKSFLKNVKRVVIFHIYNAIKGKNLKGSYFWSNLRSLWKSYKNRVQLTYPRVKKLSDLKDIKFVYFPLATEPEMSLHWMSPEYISQLTAITSIARDLPANTFLVIKESIYSVSARSDEFYGHIKRLKNTILVDISEPGLDVISAAKAVITVTGTSGLEAAIMGKPVVLFGRHNYYDFLDHVFLVKQEEQLLPALQTILNDQYDVEKAKIDGARLRQAAINASFDLKEFTNIHRNQFNEEVLQNIVEGLRDSLSDENVFPDQSSVSIETAGKEYA